LLSHLGTWKCTRRDSAASASAFLLSPNRATTDLPNSAVPRGTFVASKNCAFPFSDRIFDSTDERRRRLTRLVVVKVVRLETLPSCKRIQTIEGFFDHLGKPMNSARGKHAQITTDRRQTFCPRLVIMSVGDDEPLVSVQIEEVQAHARDVRDEDISVFEQIEDRLVGHDVVVFALDGGGGEN